VKILVVGDSYWSVACVRAGRWRGCAGGHEVTSFDVVDEPGWQSDHALRNPRSRSTSAARVSDRASSTATRSWSSRERRSPTRSWMPRAAQADLRRPRRSRERRQSPLPPSAGSPSTTTPARMPRQSPELTIAFLVHAGRAGCPRSLAYLEGGGELARDKLRRRQVDRHDLDGHVLGLGRVFGQVGSKVARIAAAIGMSVSSTPVRGRGEIAASGRRPGSRRALSPCRTSSRSHARATADNRG